MSAWARILRMIFAISTFAAGIFAWLVIASVASELDSDYQFVVAVLSGCSICVLWCLVAQRLIYSRPD